MSDEHAHISADPTSSTAPDTELGKDVLHEKPEMSGDEEPVRKSRRISTKEPPDEEEKEEEEKTLSQGRMPRRRKPGRSNFEEDEDERETDEDDEDEDDDETDNESDEDENDDDDDDQYDEEEGYNAVEEGSKVSPLLVKEKVFKTDLATLGVSKKEKKAIIDLHKQKPNLSAYECRREVRIRQNNEMLKGLGLLEEKPWIPPPKPKVKSKRPIKRKVTAAEPSRRSERSVPATGYVHYFSDQLFRRRIASDYRRSSRYDLPEPARRSERKSERTNYANYFADSDSEDYLKSDSENSDNVESVIETNPLPT